MATYSADKWFQLVKQCKAIEHDSRKWIELQLKTNTTGDDDDDFFVVAFDLSLHHFSTYTFPTTFFASSEMLLHAVVSFENILLHFRYHVFLNDANCTVRFGSAFTHQCVLAFYFSTIRHSFSLVPSCTYK